MNFRQELEQEIIGQCLLEKRAFPLVVGKLKAKNFQEEHYRILWETMSGLYPDLPITITTVWNALRNHAQCRELIYTMVSAMGTVSSARNLGWNVIMLMEFAFREALRNVLAPHMKNDIVGPLAKEYWHKATDVNFDVFETIEDACVTFAPFNKPELNEALQKLQAQVEERIDGFMKQEHLRTLIEHLRGYGKAVGPNEREAVEKAVETIIYVVATGKLPCSTND